MASIGLDFTQITPDNGAVRDLNQMIFADVLSAEKIGSLLNVFKNVYNGDKLGIIGEFGLLGTASTGCNPTWGNDAINTTEKTWNIAAWQIAEQLCYADVENTLVKYTLNTGTDIADMTANDYLKNVVEPRLELAIMKMLLRIAFFGDTAADTTAQGGVLKVGVSPAYFTLTDGIFKQLYTAVTAGTTNRVTITANSQSTKAAQMAGISSEAVDVLDGMINNAAPALRQQPDQIIYITQSFADGLEAQLLKTYYGSELHWTALFDGIKETSYRGIKVRVLPQLDEIIQSYEGTATAYNLPHRAIYTTERNLALGVNGTDEFGRLRISFDETTLLNHIYATDKMGVLVVDEAMAVIAY